MIRILWADDQTDVINTFSSVLAPLAAKIITARDGEEAINRIRNDYFDILLLDLKMPPNEWGGLWALEEIRKFNQKIPVIIISGEGTQNETIRALRMGAHDYVTKDSVQSELLERVGTLLQETNKKAISDSMTHFPTPISFPYKRYINTSDVVTRLHRLIEFFEAYLRFCCIIGFCELAQAESVNIDPAAFRQLIQSPTMGGWNQARQLLAKNLHQSALFFQLNSPIEYEFALLVIKIRNDIAHGSEPSEAQARSYLRDCEDKFSNFTRKLWQRMSFDLVFPTRLQFDGTNFEIEVTVICGNNSALPKASIQSLTPLVSNQVYVMDRLQKTWVNLFPWIILEPSSEPATWKILVFDGLRMDKNSRNIEGDETIRYIEMSSGQRNVVPSVAAISGSLPTFVRS